MKPKKIGNKTHNIEKLDYVKMRIAVIRNLNHLYTVGLEQFGNKEHLQIHNHLQSQPLLDPDCAQPMPGERCGQQ